MKLSVETLYDFGDMMVVSANRRACDDDPDAPRPVVGQVVGVRAEVLPRGGVEVWYVLEFATSESLEGQQTYRESSIEPLE